MTSKTKEPERMQLIGLQSDALEQLMELVGLPRTVQWFEIKWSIEDVVSVDCGYLPEEPAGQATYKGRLLHELSDAELLEAWEELWESQPRSEWEHTRLASGALVAELRRRDIRL